MKETIFEEEMKETIFYETPEGRKICPDLGAYVFEGHDENGNEIYRDLTSKNGKKIKVKPYYGKEPEKMPAEYQGLHYYDPALEKADGFAFECITDEGVTRFSL